MTIQECLSRNLKFYRKEKNLTQSQLAEKCNTSTNYIATIETGKKYPSPTTLEKIAKILEIDAIELFQLETNKSTNNIKIEKMKEDLFEAIKEDINNIIR